MEIIIATFSVLAITLIIHFINGVLPFKICPLCAGVSGTWLLLSMGVLAGELPIAGYESPIALLMGGTVVGIGYQGERRFASAAENIFRFRVPVILIGFPLAYLALKNISWAVFAAEAIILTSVLYVFFIMPKEKKILPEEEREKIAELEKEMEECC